jgi:protein TonB
MDLSDSLSRIVLVSFWVDTIGSTYNHKIEKGITTELDNEALRVCRLLKFEKPAYSNCVPVEIQYTLPVDFSSATDRKDPNDVL